MKRSFLFLAALSAALAFTVTDALAHEDKTDPVCGMRVDPEVVPWKADYAGETYYFCMEADRTAFLAEPEKYAGALTLTSARDRYELVLVVRPRTPVVGTTVKFVVRGFALGDRMASPPQPPKPLEDVTALIYEIDRSAPPRAERYRLGRLKSEDEDAFVLAKVPTRSTEWRVVVDGKLDGVARRGIFTISVAPVSTATASTAVAAPGGHEGHASAPGEPLSMQAQHDTMKQIGREWYSLNEWLRGRGGSQQEAFASLAAVEGHARDVPRFALHKFPGAIDEFRVIARSFVDKDLPAFRTALESGDRARGAKSFREVDAQSCTRCHLKFRWGTVEDLSRFPDLRAPRRSE